MTLADEVAGPLFFAATRAFGDYFSPEHDPEHVVCTFSGGGGASRRSRPERSKRMHAGFTPVRPPSRVPPLAPSHVRFSVPHRWCTCVRVHGPAPVRRAALFDYTIMDSIVALTAAYKAEGKSITFHALRPSAVKMLKKADYWTKEVVYVEESVSEHHDHAASIEGGDYSKHANIKRRITGLAAPSWSSTPGTGIYAYEPALNGSQLQTTTPQLHPTNGAV
jgi:hypothetical protein